MPKIYKPNSETARLNRIASRYNITLRDAEYLVSIQKSRRMPYYIKAGIFRAIKRGAKEAAEIRRIQERALNRRADYWEKQLHNEVMADERARRAKARLEYEREQIKELLRKNELIQINKRLTMDITDLDKKILLRRKWILVNKLNEDGMMFTYQGINYQYNKGKLEPF